MVFSLPALWWRKVRGLWKLLDGRDWLRGKLGLVLMGGAMLSKSLIQFSVDGWGCVKKARNRDLGWYFKEGHHYLHYLHRSLASHQIKRREHSPAPQQKIGLKIYLAWPLHQNKTQFPPVSLSHQEASISLLSLSIRGQADWKPQSQKTNQSDHMDHRLV